MRPKTLISAPIIALMSYVALCSQVQAGCYEEILSVISNTVVDSEPPKAQTVLDYTHLLDSSFDRAPQKRFPGRIPSQFEVGQRWDWEEVYGLQKELEREGGQLRIARDKKPPKGEELLGTHFGVTSSGRPYIFMQPRGDVIEPSSNESITHERDHFRYWKILREEVYYTILQSRGFASKSRRKNIGRAGVIAHRLMTTHPEARLFAESRAVAKELKNRISNYEKRGVNLKDLEKDLITRMIQVTPQDSKNPMTIRGMIQFAFSRAIYPYSIAISNGFKRALYLHQRYAELLKEFEALEENPPKWFGKKRYQRLKASKLLALNGAKKEIERLPLILTDIMQRYVVAAKRAQFIIQTALKRYARVAVVGQTYSEIANEVAVPYLSPNHFLADSLLQEYLHWNFEVKAPIEPSITTFPGTEVSRTSRIFVLFQSVSQRVSPPADLFDFSKPFVWH